MDAHEIAMRYLKSDFIVNLAATLPLPQFVIWYVIPATKTNGTGHANNTLALIVLIQYVPRLFVIFPLNQRIIKATGFIAKTAWAGAAYNLLLYILASQVLGVSWYLASIGRQHSCWDQGCRDEFTDIPPCNLKFYDCASPEMGGPDREYWQNSTSVISRCDANNDESDFKFGMFADAFTSEIASSRFIEKYIYCLWWGLRNLSSYGQNLTRSTYLGETTFCIVLCIGGLILFARLIGDMQTYLQSMTVRLEEWRVKRNDTEEWMRHRQLPPELQERFVGLININGSLHEELMKNLFYNHCLWTFIVKFKGIYVLTLFAEFHSSRRWMTYFLMPYEKMIQEELLTWALVPNSSLNLPSSTHTVKTLTEVEAFALKAEDLKFVAMQFKRLHSKKLQHGFRYYSHQWRTWGACFIQAAWRRYKKKKLAKELALQESFYYMSIPGHYMSIPGQEGNYSGEQDGDSDDESAENTSVDSPNNAQYLGAPILASKFAANTRRGAAVQKVQVTGAASSSLKMPKLFKPNEPDFFEDV